MCVSETFPPGRNFSESSKGLSLQWQQLQQLLCQSLGLHEERFTLVRPLYIASPQGRKLSTDLGERADRYTGPRGLLHLPGHRETSC